MSISESQINQFTYKMQFYIELIHFVIQQKVTKKKKCTWAWEDYI